jgi:hypothetical protein
VIGKLIPGLTKIRDAAAGEMGAALDRFLVRTALNVAQRSPDRERISRGDISARLADLARVVEAYSEKKYLTEPESFFVVPPMPSPEIEPVRVITNGVGAVVELTWKSGFETVHTAPRNDYDGYVENRTAHARMWMHPTPQHAMVCVHGYLGGYPALEERAFSASWLYDLGLDVVIPTLPFHGRRCPEGRQGMFPAGDPWRTVEGFAQSIYDLRSLAMWLRARGALSVTFFGMSLGAYTTALMSTLDLAPDYSVLMIPLASLSDAYMEHREGRAQEAPTWLSARLEDAFRVVSPLARKARISGENVLILSASGDQITRASHAEKLRDHFDAKHSVFPGGHILQLGRGQAMAVMARFLSRHGVIPAR